MSTVNSEKAIKRLIKSSDTIVKSINSLCRHIESANNSLDNLPDNVIEDIKVAFEVDNRAKKINIELDEALTKLKNLL
jgi:hypothetical protein